MANLQSRVAKAVQTNKGTSFWRTFTLTSSAILNSAATNLTSPATGDLLPEYREEAIDLWLDLEPESLVPVWWPRESQDGEPLLLRLRVQSFRWSLLRAVESFETSAFDSAKSLKGSDSAMPAATSSRPRLVLRSLRQFLSALPPDSTPTPD